MTAVVTLDLADWRPVLSETAAEAAQRALEEGRVIRLPQLGFSLTEFERRFLSPAWSSGRAKNISFDGVELKGAVGTVTDRAHLAAMLARFAAGAAKLVRAVFPRLAPFVAEERPRYPSTASRSGAEYRDG